MSLVSRLTSLTPYLIPENSAATPGLWNVPLSITEQNFSAISAAVNSLVVNASGLSGIINGGLAPYSLNPDGSTDNAAALATLDAAAATGWALIPPGNYAVKSTMTLVANYIRCPGAKFTITSGKTVNQKGYWIQPDDQAVATSGGNLYWLSPQPARPQWWGVRGDYDNDNPTVATDDALAWSRCFLGVPDQGVIDNLGVHSAISSTITVSNREGVYVGNRHWPTGAGNGGQYNASFTWSGATSTTSDHAMFKWDRCRHCVIEGTAFWAMGKANVCVSTDSLDGDAHGSTNRLTRCLFTNGGPNPLFVGFDIGRTSGGNQEFHEIDHCKFAAGYFTTTQLLLNASTGSSHFTVSPGYNLNSYDSGRRIRYWNGTSCSTSTVVSWISNSYGIIQDTFGSTITSAQAIIADPDGGVGIRLGASADIDDIKVTHCNFSLGQYGVELINGNVSVEDCTFSDYEVDICCSAGNGRVTEKANRSEQARSHVRGVNSGYKITESSFGLNNVLPGGGFIEPLSGPQVTIEDNSFEGVVPKGSTVYDLRNFSGSVFWKNNAYEPSTTTTTSGHVTTSASHIARVAILEHAVLGQALWVMGSEASTRFDQPMSLSSRLLSTRTLAASKLTASAGNTNIVPNELGIIVGGASGASLYVHSAGTIWVFNSAASAKAT